MNKAVEIFRKHTMKIVLVLIVIFFSVMTKGQMFAASSFQALIAQNAYVFVLATGMLMCMLTGGNIDLSVGSFVCFVGAIGGLMMVRGGMSVPAAMLLMLGAGVIYGIVEGFLIAYINIPPWIATLAGYLAFRGWGTALLNGGTIAPMPEGFIKMFNGSVPDLFGGAGLNITCIAVGVIACVIFVLLQLKGRNDKLKKGYEAESMGSVIVRCVLVCAVVILFAFKLAQAGGIPNNLIWVAVIVLIYNFISSKTTIGRYFYTIGGWMTMARLSAATPTAGTNYEMDAISACVVGGVSAYGGSGTVFGMVVGATLIGVINLGMSLMGIDANWQKVVKGVVLLAAVVFEIMNNRDKTKE